MSRWFNVWDGVNDSNSGEAKVPVLREHGVKLRQGLRRWVLQPSLSLPSETLPFLGPFQAECMLLRPVSWPVLGTH